MNILLQNISKAWNDFRLSDVSLTIQKGEYFVIVGPSGAGKTVILELLAGLLRPDTGNISGMDNRRIGFIYQDYMLFPHLTVADNIGYGLRVSGMDRGKVRARVRDLARPMDILSLLNRRIQGLSGGEKQRVAIARALAVDPEVFLIDEPTSALDSRLQRTTRNLLSEVHRRTGSTFIHVTHDFEEALSLGDRVAVLLNGTIRQCDTPEKVFNHPADPVLADFLGYRNVFSGPVRNHRMALGNHLITVPRKEAEKATAAIREDDILLSPGPLQSSARNSFRATVCRVIPLNSLVEVTLDAGVKLTVHITRKSREMLNVCPGREFYATFKVSSVRVFP